MQCSPTASFYKSLLGVWPLEMSVVYSEWKTAFNPVPLLLSAGKLERQEALDCLTFS